MGDDYLTVNKANWDERAPEHAKSTSYSVQRLIADPHSLSDVVKFDAPGLDFIRGLDVVHLQCHIGTDTLSLARLGAGSVTGLDFSPVSLQEARKLTTQAASGEKVRFVESDVYNATNVLEPRSFDLVYTGVGALCWLPDINLWARTVSDLLKPDGRLFIREGHPMLWAVDEQNMNDLVLRYPYFETGEPMVFDEPTTYVKLEDDAKAFTATRTNIWNHGIGEIVQSLLDVGFQITRLVEHKSVPWNALPGRMVEDERGEFTLKQGQDIVPLSYTLQAKKIP